MLRGSCVDDTALYDCSEDATMDMCTQCFELNQADYCSECDETAWYDDESETGCVAIPIVECSDYYMEYTC
jgi:hypothetical protein